MSQERLVRVIEGGGSGFRRCEVVGQEIGQITKSAEDMDSVDKLLDLVLADLPTDAAAVGFSIAGALKDHSIVVKSPNIPWMVDVDLGALITKRCGLPAYIANDMEASVTGMATMFPDLAWFAGITWSSGIGVRLCKNGQIVSDSEAGHTRIDYSPYAPLCGCGQRGCVESICSGTAVIRRVYQELDVCGIKIPSEINPAAFLDASYLHCGSHPWAKEIYRLVALGMGHFLTILQNNNHLPAIVWKGTFGQHALRLNGIEDDIRKVMRENLMNPEWERDLKFYFVDHPVKDGEAYLGASHLALSLVEQ